MRLLGARRTKARRGGANGGFPDPPAGEPIQVVERPHRECGAETRIRLPRAVPERVVRRVVCDGCGESYEAHPEKSPGGTAEPAPTSGPRATLGAALLGVRDRFGDGLHSVRKRLGEVPRPAPPDIPRSRLRAWASVPLAVLAVIVGLVLIQGSDPAPTPAGPDRTAAASDARFVERPGYSLALPAGWKRTNPPDGAVFAAASTDGLADATLWIERAPEMSFERFERRSLRQLSDLGGRVRVVDRVDGPTVETSIVELRADAPIAEGVTAPYRVTLRAAGPFRHYFVTVTQPGAEAGLLADAELMHGSLRPEVESAGGKADGS